MRGERGCPWVLTVVLRTEANKAIDSFDKKVTEEAAKAKSTVGGWFGGK